MWLFNFRARRIGMVQIKTVYERYIDLDVVVDARRDRVREHYMG